VRLGDFAAAQVELLLGEHDDAAAFGRFVGERGELRGVGEPFAGDAGRGDEVGGHAVAEGDGAGLVEQQDVDVAGGFDGAAGGGDDVAADEAVHAADADGAEQAADGGRDQADEQRDEHG
jgi:cobalamin biosynthesis protein CobT